MKSIAPWRYTILSQVMSPTSLTTSTTLIFQDGSADIDTEPSYFCDAELVDELFRKALSSPLSIQEREEPADRRQAYRSHEESLLPAQSFCAHARTERPVHELSSCQKRKSSRDLENKQIRILFERQKEQIFSGIRTEITSFKPILTEKVSRNGIIESQRREIDHTIAGDEQLRRDQLLFHENNHQNKIGIIECQDTVAELTARIQELQNEVDCLNDSRDFEDVEARSGLSHVPSQPALLPPFRDPDGMLSRSVGTPSRKDEPLNIWDTHDFPEIFL